MPAALVAPSRAEPAMPAGLSVEGFLGFLTGSLGEDGAKAWWEWFTVTYPDWARDGWARVDAARTSFRLTQPSGPP